jgi:uncharacterized membrane protein YoaK (UPF0700 family)
VTAARAQVTAAVLLALAAGTVDAVSFIVLHQMFTANMTGNSTELGIAAGHGDEAALVPLAVAVGTFVGAIALGTAGIELARRRGLRSTGAPAFLLEAALLAAFMVDGREVLRHNTAPDHAIGGFYALLTLAVLAMGIQTAALTKALGATVRTTYVSGLLTTFAQELVGLALPRAAGGPSYLRDELGLGTRTQSLVRLVFHLAVWTAFVAGAVWGAFGERRWTTWALAVPVAALLVAVAVDARRPVHAAA